MEGGGKATCTLSNNRRELHFCTRKLFHYWQIAFMCIRIVVVLWPDPKIQLSMLQANRINFPVTLGYSHECRRVRAQLYILCRKRTGLCIHTQSSNPSYIHVFFMGTKNFSSINLENRISKKKKKKKERKRKQRNWNSFPLFFPDDGKNKKIFLKMWGV